VASDFRSGDALFGVDDQLRVVLWNDACARLTGVGAGEAVGRPCWDLLRGVDEDGGVVCHAGCSGARLAREGYPLPCRHMLIRAHSGRRLVSVGTIAVTRDGESLYLHFLRNGQVEPEPERPEAILTPRRLEVLRLLAEGLPAKVVAARLGLAEVTVRNHIRGILTELGCHSQLEAVAEARRRKIV
jgi:DNA-binding CsgD family transcriptional regulator